MRPSALVFALSLLANAVLVLAAVARSPVAPLALHDFFARHFSSHNTPFASVQSSARPATKPAPHPPLWSTLGSGDLTTLVARLRAAGFPPPLIRAIVNAEVGVRYDARLRALIEPDPNTPYWKQSGFVSSDSKNYIEYTRLQRERAKLLRDLLGDPALAGDDVSAAQRRQFGNLPRQKIDLLQRIEDDYADMGSAIRAGMNGVTLPEDREKLALLAREKHADIAAVLTPDELADYELRSSPIVGMLSRYAGGFDANEAEFRAIFQAQQKYSSAVAPPGGTPGNMDPQSRQSAVQQLNDDLKSSLGEARYADYMRETNRDFQQLSRLAQQDNIPTATAIQAYNLRDTVVQESNRIFDDPALSADQKRAALQTLVQTTRSQTLALLGPTAGPAYVKIQDNWLKNVETGSALTFNNNTTSLSIGTVDSSGVQVQITFTGGTSYRRLPGANAAPGR